MSNFSRSDHPAALSKTPSSRALFQLREEVLGTWIRRVKDEVPTAAELSGPIIINTMPLFLEGLAEALCENCTKETATESSNTAQEHGGERARVTRYGPEQIIQEYQLLRETVKLKLRGVVALTERDDVVIQKSFDKAISESMMSYFLVHNRIREQFVATLTHDLRNPIGAVKMAAELISEMSQVKNPQDLLEIHDLSTRILRNVRRADRMIQEMLDASVVQVGERMVAQISEGNIEDVVRAAVAELPAQSAARFKLENRSIRGHWDLDAFQRSLENIISNAFKYGRDDTPVSLKVTAVHGRVLVSVHNFGNPIPAENQENLFQVFRRTESAKMSGKRGWGIGLALARSTAESMGGSLGLESTLERGTTFTIDVPCDARPFQHAPVS